MFLLDKFTPEDFSSKKDEEILALSVKDPAVFKYLVDKYSEPFLRKARSIVGYRLEVDDIVQEAFAKIYLNAERFKPVPGASFKSWAYKILINVTFTWYGKFKKDRETTVLLDPDLHEVISDKETSSVFEKESVRDYVLSVLSRLPNDFSRALSEHFIDGIPQKEIAEREGVTIEAIKTRVHRAKKGFKKISESLMGLE